MRRATMERNADSKEISDRYWLIGSSTASILFHCAAFAVLSCSATLYPVVASPSANQVLWFYPSLLFGSRTVSSEVADTNTLSRTRREAPGPVSRPVPGRTEPPAATTRQGAAPVRQADPATVAAAERSVAQETPRELSLAALRVAPHPKASPPVKTEKVAHQFQNPLQPPAPAVVAQRQPPKEAEKQPDTPAVVRPHPGEAASLATPVAMPADQKENQALSTDSTRQGGHNFDRNPEGSNLLQPVNRGGSGAPTAGGAVVKEGEVGPALPAALSLKNESTRPQGVTHAATEHNGTGHRSPVVTTGGTVRDDGTVAGRKTLSASPARSASPVPQGAAKQAEPAVVARAPVQEVKPSAAEALERKAAAAPDQAKGLFSPPLTGDIKFELVARDDLLRGVKVTVGFRDFPRSRRGRLVSRAEAMRIRSMNPKIVMPGEKAIHAIIDHAAEGVYYLRVEPDRQQVSDVSITIRLFEGSSRARNKTVRVGALAGNRTVIRLMMPEGVVWEDSSAFSGSLEDSDSVTRFNSETGMEWKEYH
ncbi:FHA domain containing protein [Pelobacter propionicus DSM 2379]|uniref:FHA domain containing protein n=1 Tax=Pelobacter propionicus (strain DSM 2379 / NBRC 103807 / OttBd1) TaxID=338966 RepID=A1ASH6_PELPD|nr:FHA domain containing protein [Pelobacter propionicus DSM 2379]